ncbi:MAG: tRNA (N(6)-L-threonylcarbamoyladenosine(37)-C(2))-methylthiotransferase MtaB [Bdellovibrionota bacterium]
MDNSVNSFRLHTFGCKVNTYDTGLVQKNLSRDGFIAAFHKDNSDYSAPLHILNTCAVTQEASKEALRLIRKIKAKNPFSKVVVTGCAAQVDTDLFQSLPSVDLVVANSHKQDLPGLLRKMYAGTLEQKTHKSNIFRKEDLEEGGGEETAHSRSFLKIQDGCNSFCSYCIIPYARGKSRSIPISNLVTKVNELYTHGFREVVLTGVHIGDYEDGIFKLEDLVEALLKKTQMPRFRLSSLEPVEVTERLLDLYQDPRMCRHFHMSIQSAHTGVLKDMKRNYGEAEVRTALQNIATRLPNSFVGMDVIVGFPTETEEAFQSTYMTLAELPWTRIHVFPYSERRGTRAAELHEQIENGERHRRAALLRQLSLSRYTEVAQSQVGQTKKVLLLKKSSKQSDGLSSDYWPVKLDVKPEIYDREIEVRFNEFSASNKYQGEGVFNGVLA